MSTLSILEQICLRECCKRILSTPPQGIEADKHEQLAALTQRRAEFQTQFIDTFDWNAHVKTICDSLFATLVVESFRLNLITEIPGCDQMVRDVDDLIEEMNNVLIDNN